MNALAKLGLFLLGLAAMFRGGKPKDPPRTLH